MSVKSRYFETAQIQMQNQITCWCYATDLCMNNVSVEMQNSALNVSVEYYLSTHDHQSKFQVWDRAYYKEGTL